MSIGTHSAVLQRRLKIAEWIRRHGQMRVDELSEALDVSTVTIRGDLNYLEEQGVIVRSFGKAIAARSGQPRERVAAASVTKSLALPMLRLASRVIEADQTLLIGHGDLPQQIIPLLGEIPGLSVILASLDAVPLARACLDGRVHVLGGEIGPDSASLEGALALRSLEFYSVSHFLMQAEMLNNDGNLLLATTAQQRFTAAACRRAERRIVLLERTPLSLETRPSGIALAAVSDVIFPASPSGRARDVLEAAGLSQMESDSGPAAHFSRFRSEAAEGVP